MIAIKVHDVSKKFKVYASPRKRLLEYISMGRMTGHTDFLALDNINFEIKKGTTVGIIGQNGSGKSTLLSILAGVLQPSGGTYSVNGKISAILELGAGFHPEFTGRDNVYMYASIMGLSKEEIDEKFDEILHFSELEDFIDQPLRTYSSGMVVRLAFSVAINVNSDILIVDEALAVGDVIFQHRCFRKIRDMQESGKTILYVGHDTEAVRNLCNYAILLDGGRIIEQGDADIIINKYHALISERERNRNEGNLEEKGELLPERYETKYNFIEKLEISKKSALQKDWIRQETVEIESKPRKIIFAHPPAEIEYDLTIDPGFLLGFAIGLMPGAWDKIKYGVKFDINIEHGSVEKNIFTKILKQTNKKYDVGWHNFKVDLRDYSGKDIKIKFITSATDEDLSYCWAAWGWPKIFTLNNVNGINGDKTDIEYGQDNSAPDDKLIGYKADHIMYGNGKAKIIKVELLDENRNNKSIFKSGELAIIKVQIKVNEDIESNLHIGFVIRNKYGDVYGISTKMYELEIGSKKKNDILNVEFRQYLNLGSGIYSLTNGISIVYSDRDYEVLDRHEDWKFFRIERSKQMWGYADLNTSITIC